MQGFPAWSNPLCDFDARRSQRNGLFAIHATSHHGENASALPAKSEDDQWTEQSRLR
jgi:hypothetical protein